MKTSWMVAAAGAALLGAASPSLAQTASAPGALAGGDGGGVGVRILGGLDPDQIGVGVQSRVGHFAEGKFAPSIDLAIGDDLTTLCFNGDLLWNVRLPGSSAAVYAGGGPTLTYWNPEVGDGDTEIGVSLVGGLGLPLGEQNRYNFELRLGLGDVPDLRFAFGFLLGT